MSSSSTSNASGAPHDAVDGDEHAVEVGDLFTELATASGGERVVARATASRRRSPLRRDPATLLQPLERGVERSLLDRQDGVGQELDLLRDRVAVERLHGERLQDQHVERALEQLALRRTG